MSTRSEFLTRFKNGAPMQIEVGLRRALERLNGDPIDTVEVRLIGLGDATPIVKTGPFSFPEGSSRAAFYKECESRAHQARQSIS